MKRLFIMLTLAGTLFVTSSYANSDNGSPAAVTQAFQSSFSAASDIKWEQVGVLYKASFALNGQYSAAFYNRDGELIALTSNIATKQLPQALRVGLKNELQHNWISEAFVVSIEGNRTYYVQLENADTRIVLKSAGAKKWTVYQKSDK